MARHALAWLVVGCAVGLLLSILLLAPRLGDLIAPLEYGRWAALHLDLTLYGWLALPLAGVLLHAYGAASTPRAARSGLALWSAALVAGAASWLAGRTSGKLFLDWSGPAAWVFVAAQAGLALVLAAGWVASPATRSRRAALALLWLALAAVPVVLKIAEGETLYPPVDPSSGGPTGTSLFGSSLGMVAILLLVPWLLGLPRRETTGGDAIAVAVLAAQGLACVALGAGDRSNDEPFQIAALASLLVWIWLLPRQLGRYSWADGSLQWLRALYGWGALLLATGVGQFLPPALARAKFTHLLVAHAHVAMAGFASSLAFLLLHARLAASASRGVLGERGTFWLWQCGAIAHVATLFALGAAEARDPAAMLRGGAGIDALLALRACAGALQLRAAVGWLGRTASGLG